MTRIRMAEGNPCASMGSALALLIVLFGLNGMASAQTQEHWPQFRGLGSRGIASGTHLPVRWSATENVAWKTDLPGRGWSSPIAWGDRVLLTTAVNSGELESPTKGLYFGGNRPEPRKVQLDYKVLCLDLASGKRLWERSVHQGPSNSPIHLKNSFASETPVTDGKRVYAYFGNQGLHCLDLDGRLVWSRPMDPRPTRNGWGPAASPVLHGERLYLVNDNEQESFLIALDKNTGEQVWRAGRDEKSNWATPFIWENDRRTEIITPGTGKTRSYGLDGKLLWEFGGMSSHTIPTPLAAHGLLFVTSGYINTPVRPLFAIRPGATGDITLPEDQAANQYIAWCQRKAGPYNPSPIVYGDFLYVLYDRGMIACYDARTGKEVYGLRRIGPGAKAFTSSPWAYDGKIFCLNEDGVTFVLRAGTEFGVLHTNDLADDDMCMATPAIIGDRLLIRTSRRVYCVRQNARAPFALWDAALPFPTRASLAFPDGMKDVMVHRAGADAYNFLHDSAIVKHKENLFAAWYNCPRGEMVGESLIRGRRSQDGGRTWSGVETIAGDVRTQGIMYVPVAFLSYGGTLHAFVTNMKGGPDLVHDCEVFVLNEKTNAWTSRGFIAGPFLPNCAPQRMVDNTFIMAGRMAEQPGRKPTIPAVAISREEDLTKPWDLVPLLPAGKLADGQSIPCPETTVLVEGREVTALVRRERANSLVFFSHDNGRTWTAPCEHNFPMEASKIYAGLLSTGQRYVLCNIPGGHRRELLAIAVSRPGQKQFSKMWKLRDGADPALKSGPEWSYPCAIEADGKLHVVYTSEKHHCVLTTIPLKSLDVNGKDIE